MHTRWKAMHLLRHRRTHLPPLPRRKSILTGFVLLIPRQHDLGRVVVALLVCGAFLVTQMLISPFRRASDNLLAAAAQLALLIIYLAVLLVKVCKSSADTCEQFGLGESGGGVVVFFLGFSFASLLSLVLFGTVRLLYGARQEAPLLHLKETRAVPLLSTAPGISYHMFLSHVWSTGQDQVAVIKRQLQLCLLGASIFLDVEDLVDISALEKYIETSAVVLIFISKGYFLSRNCSRELRATALAQKPTVLVHEADPAKGGIPLRLAMDECPEDIRGFVFRDRAPIRWHRVVDFQRYSLKLIGEALLRGCPMYLGKDSLELYFPGEIRCEELRFKAAKTLQTSVSNPGAAAAGLELCNRFTNLQLETISTVRNSRPETGLVAQYQLSITFGQSSRPAVFLLYLNRETFVGGAGAELAEEVRAARASNKRILLLHENDPARQGCEFSTFFETTPPDLINDGLYSTIAVALYEGPHRKVSLALAAQAMGAVRCKPMWASSVQLQVRRMPEENAARPCVMSSKL
uniref:TIR domain-containing protein n=1 Tax=Calcidiscus leptoporus TaxID=127549 RepID=A0A7S0J4D0_9EUKA|mmetsp:Transcript_38946/g.91076  ORF Transcript_38946/g.91076 Transcript_38946/m.91076 type:complete len:520 (+) Transcript_38946:141-1700(+)